MENEVTERTRVEPELGASEEARLLAPYRILDLTDQRGVFAGSLLAQLGAEVILVELPEGSRTRSAPDAANPRRGSPWHHAFNRGKSSVVVDWRTDAGKAQLARMCDDADAIILSGGPAEHVRDGLPAIGELAARHQHLVIANVSGFGLEGPKSDWLDGDLVCGAAGLAMSLTGDSDRAPLRASIPQVFLHAAADAAIGTLLALIQRSDTGKGQIVDASAQSSWVWAAGYAAYNAEWGARPTSRNGSSATNGKLQIRFIYPSSDGFVSITVLLGAAIGPYTQRLVDWMVELGECPEEIASTPWATYDIREDIPRLGRLNDAVALFVSTRTRAELFAAARAQRLLIAPVVGLGELLDAEQFAAREVWRSVDIAGSQVKVPGPFVQLSPSSLPELDPAPELGQQRFRPRALGSDLRGGEGTSASEPRGNALTGVRVVDLTTSFAGPLVGRMLAAFGATVIKVESERRPDTARAASPFRGRGPESSLANAHTNAGKLSLALNLRSEQGPAVLERLLQWADVLVESATPGSLARLGFTAEALRRINPSLVVLQTTMLGQTGPLSDMPGYGNMAVALSGYFALTGWPDRQPTGPSGAYTDWLAPRFGVLAVLAALDHSRRTKQGALLDLGQGECALQLLTAGLIDRQLTGRTWESMGNRDYFAAPQGVFPVEGDDAWIAIECHEDGQWDALADLLDRHDLRGLPLPERLERQDELEKLISGWTATQPGEDLQQRLQSMRIPAHVVQGSAECAVDPQLASRGVWMTEASHAELGPVKVGLPPFLLSQCRPDITSAGPILGEHTMQVMSEVLGYSEEDIAQLVVSDVLS